MPATSVATIVCATPCNANSFVSGVTPVVNTGRVVSLTVITPTLSLVLPLLSVAVTFTLYAPTANCVALLKTPALNAKLVVSLTTKLAMLVVASVATIVCATPANANSFVSVVTPVVNTGEVASTVNVLTVKSALGFPAASVTVILQLLWLPSAKMLNVIGLSPDTATAVKLE